MQEEINEKVLCVLRNNNIKNIIEVDYIKIEEQFTGILADLSKLCNDQDSSLDDVINFIKSRPELDDLTGEYSYCYSVEASYQGVYVNYKNSIDELIRNKEIILQNEKYYQDSNKSDEYDITKEIALCKNDININYIFWTKVYSISKAYMLCEEDKNILMYSHRNKGWTNPIYKLSPNFSVHIKTNFGFGHSSYFYTTLFYKKIEIAPFSDWINYEYANFHQIIRFTRSHGLNNYNWKKAMEFTRDACNLSLKDELKFVEKFIINECDEMVRGLEKILVEDNFVFKNRNTNIDRIVQKDGRKLIEFRGEKISGALNFISKINEFGKILTMKEFIVKIEICNKKIQPILESELKIITNEISTLTEEINIIKPIYDKLNQDNTDYDNKRKELHKLIEVDRTINYSELEIEFKKKYTDYENFKNEFNSISKNQRELLATIKMVTDVYKKITDYNESIINYFLVKE